MTDDDATLLRRYAHERSEAAFAEIVRRHLPLVYSAALRRLNGDAHGASDVAQTVFASVARRAAQLTSHPVLSGWLYATTRHAAIDLVRTEQRRVAREHEAHAMQTLASSDVIPRWDDLRGVIDNAMDALPERDREAVLLRHFQSRTFAEIGRLLGTSEDAARKRVERALENLRTTLGRRGITSTAAALALILGQEAAVATPAGLGPAIVATAFAAGTPTSAGIALMALTKLKLTIGVAAVLAATALVWQQHATIAHLRQAGEADREAASRIAAENRTLAKANAESEAENTRLRTEVAALRARRPSAPASGLATAGQVPAALLHLGEHADVPRDPQQLGKLHARYDPFLRSRGFTSEQIDRFVALMMQKENIRLDFQDAVRALGVPVTKDLEALRGQATHPLWDQMHEMLGDDGYAAFNDYEKLSYYRESYLNRFSDRFAGAGAALTPAQAEQLTQAIAANDHPRRRNASDFSSESEIDWPTVSQQASAFLDPAQQTVLSDFIAHQPKN